MNDINTQMFQTSLRVTPRIFQFDNSIESTTILQSFEQAPIYSSSQISPTVSSLPSPTGSLISQSSIIAQQSSTNNEAEFECEDSSLMLDILHKRYVILTVVRF